MIHRVKCPDPSVFKELLEDGLAENELERLRAHLDDCATCRRTLDEITEQEGLAAGTFPKSAPSEKTDEPAVEQLVRDLSAEDPRTEETRAFPAPEDDCRLDFLAPSEDPASLGRLGPYEIIEVIGRGGMGVVLRGLDPKLHRVVAIKVLAPELAANAIARRRFLREAQAAAAVSHDHVVTIHAVDEADRVPSLVMEYVAGRSLRERIEQEGPLEVREILRIGMQVSCGLAAAHAQGLIHRDIKPSNIMLENGVERAKITDFGLARAIDDVGMTRTGEVAGTPEYMSPEQATGQPLDCRSDLFSLGSVLYAMCTGRSPFRADCAVACLRRVCDDTPRPIRELNPDVPEWLAAITERLLEKEPDDRFQTAEEVWRLLGECLAHVQDPTVNPLPASLAAMVAGRRKGLHAGFSAWLARRRRWAVGAAVLVVALALVTLSEATGVTNLTPTVIRLATGEGTLVIEVDDPAVQVSLDGEELTITGSGIQELKLRPGQYQFQAVKNGQPVRQELVTITRGDRELIRVRREAGTFTSPAGEEPADHTSTPEGAIVEVRRLERGHDNQWVRDLAFSPDGRHLLCVGMSPEYWDLETGTVTVFQRARGPGMRVAFSPDGNLAATGGALGGIHLWNLTTGQIVREMTGHSGTIQSLAYSPDGRHLLSGGHDGSARLWSVDTGEEVWRVDCGKSCTVVAFPSHGDTALVGGGSRLRLVERESGKEIWRTREGSGEATTADFSPNGRLLVSGHSPFIHVWDATTGEELRLLRGHATFLRTVRFLPDRRRLISGSEDKTLRLWNIDTWDEVARIDAENHFTQHVAISPDGRYAATGGAQYVARTQTSDISDLEIDGDYDIRLWRLPENVWPDESANAEREAFVILGDDGAEVGKYDTLAEAVLRSGSGNTIEIRGNGPFVSDRINIYHPLIIRAGDGYRPIIHRNPDALPKEVFLLFSHAGLVLEGLELQDMNRTPAGGDKSRQYLVRSDIGGPLCIANCRLLTKKSSGVCIQSDAPQIVVRNCELLKSNWPAFVRGRSPHGAQYVIENSISTSGDLLSLLYAFGEAVTVRLNRNTVAAGGLILNVHAYHAAEGAVVERAHVDASANLFDTVDMVLHLQPFLEGPAIQPEKAEAYLRHVYSWRDRRNLFCVGDSPLATLGLNAANTLRAPAAKDLEEWRRLWESSDEDAIEGTIRYQGFDVAAKADDWPENLTPEDFRLRPDSAGYRAGPDGRDLGADVDLVGPGEAYERWKKTPEYRQWQEETRRLMKTALGEPRAEKAASGKETEDDSEAAATQAGPTPAEDSSEEQPAIAKP